MAAKQLERLPNLILLPKWPIYNSHSGQKLGYFYYEEEPGRRSAA